MSKLLKHNHELANELWETGFHECRLLAIFIEDHRQVTEQQMDEWVVDFNSWDLCDQCCSNLFVKLPIAYQKAEEWCHRPEEFVRRAGFVVLAALAVHDKQLQNADFEQVLPLIIQYATDERNFVKKAVNRALRQIGKRNNILRLSALDTAYKIKQIDSKSARWIATDAIRELESEKTKRFIEDHRQ